jgi:hypothetical protein
VSGEGRRVVILSRSSAAEERKRSDAARRFPAVIDALAEVGFITCDETFDESSASLTLSALDSCDAVLVWVDPISDGKDRSILDEVLCNAADGGPVVYTHPDTVLKMGTKDVLFDTRALSWSLDVDRYDTLGDFVERFPTRLAAGTPCVVKQHRGNGGQGVWKVAALPRTNVVRIQHAAPRGGATEDLTVAQLMERMAPYFDHGGHLVQQDFATRVAEGMVRAYLVKGAVVGFARQYSDRGGTDNPAVPAESVFGLPAEKVMREADDAEFVSLRRSLEVEWVPDLQRLLNVSDRELPLLWDADFLLGPPLWSGENTYLLCEINVSCVSPFPSAVPRRLAASLAGELDAGWS